MELVNWLDMNIVYEETLFERSKKQFGAFHQKTKIKGLQIDDLKQAKINQLETI